MEITEKGKEVINQLNDYFNHYSDDHKMANAIKEKYNIKEVHVVPGDSDEKQSVKEKWADRLASY